MYLALFAASFLLSLIISVVLVWLFTKPIEDFLHRFIIDPMICSVWSKYLRFAVVAVGVSTGTRVETFRDYVAAPSYSKGALAAQVTQEFWALELYHTAVGTAIGLTWLLLAFCVMTVVAKMIIKPVERNETRGVEEQERNAGAAISSPNHRI
jgi:hypothetical protein